MIYYFHLTSTSKRELRTGVNLFVQNPVGRLRLEGVQSSFQTGGWRENVEMKQIPKANGNNNRNCDRLKWK